MQLAKFAMALVPSLSSSIKLPPIPVSAPHIPSIEILDESLETTPLSFLEQLSFPEVDPLVLQETKKAEFIVELQGVGIRERKERRNDVVTVVKKVTDWSKGDRAKIASAFQEGYLSPATIAESYSGCLLLGAAKTPEIEALHLQAYTNLDVLVQLGIYSGLTKDQVAAMIEHCFFESRFGVEPKKDTIGLSALPEGARESIEKKMIREFKGDVIKWGDLSTPVQEALIMIELYVRGTELFETVQNREPRVDEMAEGVFRYMAREAYFLENSGAKKEYNDALSKIENANKRIYKYVKRSQEKDLSDRDKKKLEGYREDVVNYEKDLKEIQGEMAKFQDLFLERSERSEFEALERFLKYAPIREIRSAIVSK